MSMPFGGLVEVIDLFDRANFQEHSSSGLGVIEVERSNFDLEYLRYGATCDLELFIVGDPR